MYKMYKDNVMINVREMHDVVPWLIWVIGRMQACMPVIGHPEWAHVMYTYVMAIKWYDVDL